MPPTPLLEDADVRLEPLTLAHVPDLLAAARGDRSSYGFTWVPGGLGEMHDYVNRALAAQAAGDALPYAVRLPGDGAVVGCTRLWDLLRFDVDAPYPQAAEIGYTWYAPRVQRTVVNTAAKALLLGHAFDDWGALRVCLKTDARNERSRAAIARLGAAFEGVRRRVPSTPHGTVRDVAYFSIVREEWPQVRDRLAALRERRGAGER